MPNDIFNRSGETFGGSFAADGATVVFATGGSGSGSLVGASGGVGLLAQQIQVGYQQQIMRFYEIGSQYTFLVAGRAQGQFSMGQILGPRPVQTAFYSNYGDVCNAANNNLNFSVSAGCNGNSASTTGSLNFSIVNVVLTSIALTVAAQDMVINQQVAAMFVALNAA
jgi:hypothetical protein